MENLVIIGSRNPVKVACVREAFEESFSGQAMLFRGIEVASGVSNQPMSDEETLRGAKNRAVNARVKAPDAQFWVGIEGGIADQEGRMEAFAWIVILSGNDSSRARTATFLLPQKIAKLVRKGVELGLANDQVFGVSNSKQKSGAVGLLTHGRINRAEYYAHAITLALIPFINEDVFRDESNQAVGL